MQILKQKIEQARHLDERYKVGPTKYQDGSSKGHWTKEEDVILTEAVAICNGKNWKKVAESLPGRTDVQCLHRW